MARIFVLFAVLFVAVGAVAADGVGAPRTDSGCIWPTGIVDNPELGAGWLAAGAKEYFAGAYHLGKDIMISASHPSHAQINDPVYAVCDGEVVLINASDSWGKGNCAVLVRHQFGAGAVVACYGHLQTGSLTRSSRQTVQAGGELGRIGQWVVRGKSMPHLHFGVHPGELASVNLHRLGLEYLPKGWQPGQPLDDEGWVDPIKWITTQMPINKNTQMDSHPAWDPDANRLYFVRREGGQQKVWVSNSEGKYARPIWTIPDNQEVEQLLSYQGTPMVVSWLAGKSKAWQPDRTIRSFPGKGWLSQTLYNPGGGSWTWVPSAGRATHFWPDSNEVVDQGGVSAGVRTSSVYEVSSDDQQRRIPIVAKTAPALPWDQFSWTVYTDFHEEFPIMVLKSGELWWTMFQAKYSLPDYEQNRIVEFWTTKSVRLTRLATHGRVDEFTMAQPQRLYAASGGRIWRLDFDAKGTRWRQITGGDKVISQKFKS